ncbi:AAA family ATPase [Aeromicrobium sp. UC242_57]|uniref:AAA family ATPase n=1 Tax=Aeromicrobium sp. UC242_57 TaxID=3374624 RepID=UPI0037B684C6
MSKLVTRKPTGKPSWPILLLAGGEKCGKSYSAAALSASDLIDRTFYLEVGEGSADQYGALPGARYEIVQHDGTYNSLLTAAQAMVAEPRRGAKPNAIIVDSITELWDLLGNEQAAIAKGRGKTVITMDQWNAAKKKWRVFFDALRAHNGPVILTARYELVTVMDEAGKPTKEKEWKVRAEKNTAYEVDGIIQIPKPREFYIAGMRTLKFEVPIGGNLRLPPNFSLDWFLRELGIAGNEGVREYVAPTLDQAEIDAAANDHWDSPANEGQAS